MERGALQRKGMDDDFLPDHTTAAALNAVLASSWPAAAPPARRRPEPPKPPPRRPSLAAWDVPPFALPTPSAAQRKELWASTGAGSRATTSAGASFNERAASGPTHGSDDDDEEECVFPLEGCHDAGVAAEQDGDEACGLRLQYEMVGLDGDGEYIGVDLGLEGLELDQRVQASFRSAGGRGGTDGEGGPSLGASPTLLSAIDQLAARAEAGRSCG